MADTPQQPQTVRIYDASGAPVDTTPEYAVELLRSKRGYGMAEGDTIPLRVPGERDVRMVEANEAVRGIMAREYDAAPVEVFQKQQREREFTGVAPAIAGFATGATKMLLAGAGDAALIGAAGLVGQQEATRRYLQGLEEFQPIARGLGEVTGFAAPLAASLFTGGGTGAAALAARGATAVPRALTAAGAATEAAAARGLVGLGLAEGGAVARGLSMAAGQAVEMGAYGAGEALSRVAVQRPELTGEQAVAAMGQGFLHGALAGGIGGAALGVPMGLVSTAYGRGVEAASGLVARARGAGERGVEQAIGLGERGIEAARALGERGIEAAMRAAEQAPGAISRQLTSATAAAEKLTGRVSAYESDTIGKQLGKLVDTTTVGGVKQWAGEKAIKSLGGNLGMIEKALERGPEALDRMAGIIVDEIPVMAGKRAGDVVGHETQRDMLRKLQDIAGKEKGAVVKELEKSGVKVDMRPVVANLRESIRPLAQGALDETIAIHRRLSRTIDRIEKNFKNRGQFGNVTKLWEQQKAIGSELERLGSWDRLRTGQGITAFDKASADLYFAIGNEFERLGTQATSLGPDFVKRWQRANERYSDITALVPMARKGAARDVALRSLGMSEHLGKFTMGGAGAAMGAAVAGPVGMVIGGLAGGAVGVASNHLIKKFGDQAAATVLRQVERSGGDVFQAAAVLTNQVMTDSVKGYIKAAASGAKTVGERAMTEAERLAQRAMPVAERAAERAGKAGKEAVERARRAGEAVVETAAAVGRGVAATGARGVRGVELAATKYGLTQDEQQTQASLPRAAQRTAGVPLLQASPTARVEPRTGPKGAPQGPVEQRYRAAKEAVKEFASPESQARVRMAAGLMAPGDIARATAQTAVRGSNYLMSKLPPDTMGIKTLQPKFDDITPSEQEMASFLRAAAVVDNPMSVFESLRRGDLTTDEVDALRNVYPEMYTQLQSLVLSEVATLDRPLPYDKALALGHLIGVPAHPTMTPEFIAAQQQALTAEAAKPQPRPAQRPANLARGYDLNREET